MSCDCDESTTERAHSPEHQNDSIQKQFGNKYVSI